MLDYEGLPNLEYKFYHLKINDEYRGACALEEHLSKSYLERRNINNALIFRFNEDPFWNGLTQNKQEFYLYDNEMFMQADIEFFNKASTKYSLRRAQQ
ncbi:MAG: hypothetical protein HRT71_15810 [Flavobacteriales bacterium]|nr:hypothetical protein [Flavobacteriales bacterium]